MLTRGHEFFRLANDVLVCEGEKPMKQDSVCLPKAPENLGAMRHSSLSPNFINTMWKNVCFLSTKRRLSSLIYSCMRCEKYPKVLLHFIFPLPCDAHQWTVTSLFFRWGSNTSVSSSVNREEISYVPPKEFLRKISKFMHVKCLK